MIKIFLITAGWLLGILTYIWLWRISRFFKNRLGKGINYVQEEAQEGDQAEG